MRISKIANEFKIHIKNGDPNISLVRDIILKHSNRRQFILLESEVSVFDSVYDEIMETKERLLSSEYVFLNLKSAPSIPIGKVGETYIYFLFDAGMLVYIGQTKNLISRMSKHIEKKQFDETCAFKVNKDRLLLVEQLNIIYYKPVLNMTHREPLSFFKIVMNQCCFE